jgi:uncharacterized membrane protein
MFNSEGQRSAFYFAVALAAICLAVLGQFALGGLLGSIVLGVAVLANVVTVLFGAQVPRSLYDGGMKLFALLSVVVSLVVGVIAFGWWGILYGVASIIGHLLSGAIRR